MYISEQQGVRSRGVCIFENSKEGGVEERLYLRTARREEYRSVHISEQQGGRSIGVSIFQNSKEGGVEECLYFKQQGGRSR